MLERLVSGLFNLPAILVCLTVHEAGHGLAAYLLGDTTAKASGRLSLNPLRHIDPIGLLMMLAFGFGWATPVPVDPSRFRNPKTGMALTALAGPAMNVLTAAAFLLVQPFLPIVAQGFVSSCVALSIGLAAFNLVPIPPLDGSRLVLPFLPDEAAGIWARLDRYGWFILVLAGSSGLLDGPIGMIRSGLYRLLTPFM